MATDNNQPAGKIRSLADLRAIKEKVSAQMALRTGGCTTAVTVHMGTCGIAAGARDIMNVMLSELGACKRNDIRVTASSCIGACSFEPVVTVEQVGHEPVLYGHLDAEKAKQIFREHVLGGNVVANLVFHIGKSA